MNYLKVYVKIKCISYGRERELASTGAALNAMMTAAAYFISSVQFSVLLPYQVKHIQGKKE